MEEKNQGFVLIPKTRSGTDYHNKPGIYFTGHPKDIALYFDEVSEDMLKTQNCAVYRDPTPEAVRSHKDLERVIGRMQLVVIPVTENFLDRENRARDVEFPIALRLHKPVLFWAQTNLTPRQTEIFNEKCQKLQMLIKRDIHPEPLSYASKLEEFLEANLVDHHLAERVRAEFSAYLFLSYRKKDREYVKPLMEAIHQFDCFRDTAIWYDEFLTIGENFSTAIEAAMKKSNLVVLMVTPNILEPENYVKDYEYRDACSLPRPVVPVMAEETDSGLLKEEFKGLADCIAMEDADGLAKAIRKGICLSDADSPQQHKGEREDGKGSEQSPEHDYLIGLAYLKGIDVEVNTVRGAALITRAAEQGFEEAVVRLAGMYHSGNGVPRDGKIAVDWQKKLVEMRRQRYQKEPSERNGLHLAQAQQTLGRYYDELRDMQKAKESYREMLEIGEALCAAFGSAGAVQILALACVLMGDMVYLEGNLTQASGYFERAWEQSWQQIQRRKEKEDIQDADARVYLALYSCIGCCAERMGGICETGGDLAGAQKYYQRMASINGELARIAPGEQTRRNLAVSDEKLGDICQAEGNLRQAEEYYTQSLQLFRQNREEFRTKDASDCFMVSLAKMGDVCREKGEFERAKLYYQQSLAVSGDVREALLMAEERVRRSTNYSLLGLSCLKLGELNEARLYLEHSLRLARELVGESKTQETLHLLSVSCSRLGDLCEKEGKLDEAQKMYLEDLELSRRLAEQFPKIVNKRNLALSYNRIGNLAVRKGEMCQAKKYYLRSAEIYLQTAMKMQAAKLWHCLASNYYNLCMVTEGEEREGYVIQACAIWKQLLEDDPENECYLTSVHCLMENFGSLEELRQRALDCKNRGDACYGQKNLTGAKSCYKQGIRYCRKLFQQAEQTRLSEWRVYYSMQEKLGEICWAEGSYDEADAYFEESMQICRDLAVQYGQTPDRANLAEFFRIMGEFHWAMGKRQQAKQDFGQCVKLQEELLLEDWKATGVDFPALLADLTERLGHILQAEKEYAEAEKYLRRCVELRQQRFMENPMTENAFTLANALEYIGVTMQAAGKPENSLECLQQCLNLRFQLFQQQKTEENYDALGLVYYHLAMGSIGESRSRYADLAYGVWDELCKINPDSEIYRRRMATVIRDLMY